MNPIPPHDKPVLILLTSPAHHHDILDLCLERLQACTDLTQFHAIYLAANAPEPERTTLLQAFQSRHPNTEILPCEPLGHLPCVPRAQNRVMRRHPDRPILKMDDDVFATPHWFENLWKLYTYTRNDESTAFVMPLVPVSTMGVQILWNHLTALYKEEFKDLLIRGPELGDNLALHRFLWDAVLDHDILDTFQASLTTKRHAFSGPGGYASINCILYDHRLTNLIHPLPEAAATLLATRTPAYDESIIHNALNLHNKQALTALTSTLHHYSFHKVEPHLRPHIPLPRIAAWLRNKSRP